MPRKEIITVSYFWILLAFSQQIINQGISILWIIVILTLSLYHRNIIKKSKYKFRYLLAILSCGALGWFFETASINTPFFYHEFWWVQLTLSYISTLFLIKPSTARSIYWSAGTAACSLFFAFYLQQSSYSFIFILLSILSFLWMSFPRKKSHPSWNTISMWLAVSLLAGSLSYLWISFYPQYSSWAYQRWYQKQSPQKGFSWEMKLGAMNSIWNTDQDNQIILQLWGKDAPSYLKGASYQKYKKGEWFLPSHKETQFPTQTDLEYQIYSLAPNESWSPDYKIHSQDPQTLFTPLDLHHFAIPEDSLRLNSLGQWFSFHSKKHPYLFNRKTNTSSPIPDDLSLPKTLIDTLKILSEPFAKNDAKSTTQSIASFFQTKFKYTLTPPKSPTTSDPILFFLTQSQKGYCEYFAATSVLLLRSLEVPARLAKGYAFPEKGPSENQWIYRRKSAHAWVEYWTGSKWQVFDPTPTDAVPSQTPPNSLQKIWEYWLFTYSEWKDTLIYGHWRIVADQWKQQIIKYSFYFFLLPILFLFVFWIRRKKGTQSDWEQKIKIIEKRLSSHGIHRSPWIPIEEWIHQIPWESIQHPQKETWKATLVLFCEKRYSPK